MFSMISRRTTVSSVSSSWMVLAAVGFLTTATAQHFTFSWPAQTGQCDVVDLTWQNGTAPFKLFIAPIFDQPYIYDIPDAAFSNGMGRYAIELQLKADQNYVVFMGDADGIGNGGSSEIQIVQDGDDECLATQGANQTSLDFTYEVGGVAQTCKAGFELTWTGGLEDGPYNITVIPLDQGFFPYNVRLDEGVKSESDWVLNMTQGTRFTVMMNSANGYGRGGIAGAYEVSAGDDKDCIVQPSQTTGIWPSAINTNSLAPGTLPVTSPATSSAAASSGISGGGIAGIVIGVLAALALLGLILLFLLRRKRRRDASQEKLSHTPGTVDGEEGVDLGEEEDHPAMVDPFPGSSTGPTSHYSALSQRDPHNSDWGSPGTNGRDSTQLQSTSSPTFNSFRDSDLLGEGTSRSSGDAGPLPLKSPAFQSPTQPPLPMPSTPSSGKFDSPRASTSQPIHPNAGPPPGGLRVVNHDNPDGLPMLPPGATHDPLYNESPRHSGSGPHGGSNRGQRRSAEGQPGGASAAFRRHADAGRVQQEVVDLPPLYTDVPRDEDSPPLPEGQQGR